MYKLHITSYKGDIMTSWVT